MEFNKYLEIIQEEKWSGKVKESWHPPEGLFTKSEDEIAKVLHSQSDSLKQASSRLMFFINRAGKNLSDKEKKRLHGVTKILHTLYNKKEEKK